MALTVFVTGADRGLGRALAEVWAARGARVIAGVLEPIDRGQTLGSGAIETFRLDVADPASVAAAAATLDSVPIDILVNNAAILGDIDTGLQGPIDFDKMLRVYSVNALGALRVTNALLPRLLAGSTRLVVNISSEAGSIGQCDRTGWFAYAMSKAALNLQSALVHNTLRQQGGRVLVLHPGHVRTFMRGTEDTTGTLTPLEAARLVVANVDRPWVPSDRPQFLGPGGEVLPW